jgi:SAM-dependent methyltransferase
MSDNTLSLISSYPRIRPALPQAYHKIYEKEYMINRERLSFAGKLSQLAESWMHHKVSSVKGDSLLEIGAGTLNHLKYEQYKTYDIIEPFTQAYENQSNLKFVRNSYKGINDIDAKNKYDKILSVAVLEHLEELPYTLARAGLLLKENGVFLNAIPSEGGMLWHVGLALTTGIGFRLRNRLSLSPVMRHEHINNAKEIITLLKYFYEDVKITRFPFPFHHLSLYVYVKARRPKLEAINNFLQSYDAQKKANEI